MPRFDLLPLNEAMTQSATGKRAQMNREYLGYIQQLRDGQAGRLQVQEGETAAAIRRRLGAAAKVSDKTLVIKRVGDAIYFWLNPQDDARPRPRRRRGRPRRSPPAGQ